MQYGNPSSQQAVWLPTTAGQHGVWKVARGNLSFHFTRRMEMLFPPPHYHEDVLYYPRGL